MVGEFNLHVSLDLLILFALIPTHTVCVKGKVHNHILLCSAVDFVL